MTRSVHSRSARIERTIVVPILRLVLPDLAILPIPLAAGVGVPVIVVVQVLGLLMPSVWHDERLEAVDRWPRICGPRGGHGLHVAVWHADQTTEEGRHPCVAHPCPDLLTVGNDVEGHLGHVHGVGDLAAAVPDGTHRRETCSHVDRVGAYNVLP